MRLLDPREQIRLASGDMRGDPRGITGRLNGAGAEFWGQGAPHTNVQHMHHQSKMPVGPGNSTTGWEEPSPPSQRRNTIVPNYDDGTSLWGNPQQGQRMPGIFGIGFVVLLAFSVCFFNIERCTAFFGGFIRILSE